MEGPDNRLGEYLRARREQVRPEDVGLPAGGRRRVPGLRREELALLAGISSDYYIRLEQGRDHRPSTQVLDAIATVLRLDENASTHLRRLAQPGSRRVADGPERVPASLVHLVDGWTTTPAYVQNRLWDVLAANRFATALSPHYAPGVNLLREAFLDPADRRFRHDWERQTEDGVAALRASAGTDADDSGLVELVGELSFHSERFRELWARHDVRPRIGELVRFDHPQVGPLELHGEKFVVAGNENLMLVVFHADPGSTSADSLARLAGTVTAPEPPAQPSCPA